MLIKLSKRKEEWLYVSYTMRVAYLVVGMKKIWFFLVYMSVEIWSEKYLQLVFSYKKLEKYDGIN